MIRHVSTHRTVAAFACIVLLSCASAVSQNKIGVFTQQYNPARTGANRNETKLTLKNVNSTSFGKVFSYSVDGQIYAQPLYVYGVNIPGKGKHNVVYVETQFDSVYAFDADGLVSTPLWQDSFIDLAHGVEPVPCGTDGAGSDISCGVYPYYGITGTPVIDPSTNTMYLVARTFNVNTNTGYQTLHALDIATGAEKFGGPVQISGSVPGSGSGSRGGTVSFSELADIQRPGLLLLNGTVFIGWAGAEHGWIMAYNAKTLLQTGIFTSTPNAERGGVWQAGNGLASEGTYVYASSGDGMFDANTGGADYGDSLMKFDQTLTILDYFTPLDQDCRLQNDFDLASSGPVILPVQTGSKHPYQIITSGKGGSPCDASGFSPIYLADRTNLGKYNAQQDNVLQEVSGSPTGYWSSPAYWDNGTEGAVYYAGTTQEGVSGDSLKMYIRKQGVISSTPLSQSSNIFPIGATPSVSSNGNQNGIVWAIERPDFLSISPGQQPAVLYAYNATNVTNAIYNSATNATRDQGGCANKFAVPMVANGRVYVGTQNELDIFGLLGAPPAVSMSLESPCYTFAKQAVGTTSDPEYLTLTNTGNSTMTGLNLTIIGINAGDFAQSSNCTSTLAAGGSCRIKLTFTPSATGPRVASLQIADNAANSPQNAQLMGKGE